MEVKGWMVTAGMAAGSILAALAANGEGAIAALKGVPALLSAWSSGLPLGVWSPVAGHVLGVLWWATMINRMARTKAGYRPHLDADVQAALLTFGVVLLQQALVSRGAGEILRAMVSGGIAGLAAPFVGRIVRSLLDRKVTA